MNKSIEDVDWQGTHTTWAANGQLSKFIELKDQFEITTLHIY